MKKTIAALSLCVMSVSAMAAVPYPSVDMSNGPLKLKVYLPDPKNGFYRSTRFDWSGAIGSLEYKGHTYYSNWFKAISEDPRYYDLNYDDQGNVISAPYTAGVGPMEEFATDGAGLGFKDAKPGETFVKIGIGVLRKPDDARYDHSRHYDILDSGKWTVKRQKNSITFNQVLTDPASGYAYDYTKTIRLIPGKPQMVLEHTLRNTGKKAIQSTVYNHNFLTLDGQAPGPDFLIKFPFQPHAKAPVNPDLGSVTGNQVIYKHPLQGKERLAIQMDGFSDKASDNDITIENKKVGAGVHMVGDRPLSNVGYWSIKTVLTVQPYISMHIEPGESFSWKDEYTYYTLDQK
jgi:hypothetical protein